MKRQRSPSITADVRSQLGWEAVAVVRIGRLSHPAILAQAAPAGHTRLT
jgi:hypothetical protein